MLHYRKVINLIKSLKNSKNKLFFGELWNCGLSV